MVSKIACQQFALSVLREARDQSRRTELFTNKVGLIWILLSMIAGLVISCSPRTTPPGANTIYGGVEEARFSYHYWQEGLAILFWHDFVRGGEGCTGSGSTEDPVYRLECDVESGDGRSFSWKVHTRDGVRPICGLMNNDTILLKVTCSW